MFFFDFVLKEKLDHFRFIPDGALLVQTDHSTSSFQRRVDDRVMKEFVKPGHIKDHEILVRDKDTLELK